MAGDIEKKHDELARIKMEISEWEYVNGNDELQSILTQNKIIPLFTYTEAIKDTIAIFKRRGVEIDNVEVKRYSPNAVDVNINITASVNVFFAIAEAINNDDTLIVLESVDMHSIGGAVGEWEIKLKRYFNL